MKKTYLKRLFCTSGIKVSVYKFTAERNELKAAAAFAITSE